MIFISHRGNINSKNTTLENKPSYIQEALNLDYHVEIDLWVLNNILFLGHDNPKYSIDISFLNNEKLFVHCKNFEALSFLKHKKLKCDYFWHENDHYTLTSKGNIWSHFKSVILEDSIKVCLEFENLDFSSCYGICSDDIESFKKKYSQSNRTVSIN